MQSKRLGRVLGFSALAIVLYSGTGMAGDVSKIDSSAQSATNGFFMHDGDRVVFLGDSITEQKLYSSLIEMYALTRFPKWRLRFRNAGWSGDTAPGGLARLERDVLFFKPTVVTVKFGMNDHAYVPFVLESCQT